jgi:hypothetical protein
MTGPSPVDRGKPGSKIHVLSDRAGLPLSVAVSAANIAPSGRLPHQAAPLQPERWRAGRAISPYEPRARAKMCMAVTPTPTLLLTSGKTTDATVFDGLTGTVVA